ncbi:hypothetical protein M8J77_019592 [Diaphorina citri]|nr:hypothetical protein M8J77_019592 [Diaphorina citri]
MARIRTIASAGLKLTKFAVFSTKKDTEIMDLMLQVDNATFDKGNALHYYIERIRQGMIQKLLEILRFRHTNNKLSAFCKKLTREETYSGKKTIASLQVW